MPTAMINSCPYFYEDAGTGMETVVFVPGLMMSGRMFHNQVRALRSRFRCITFDLRGHARSGAPTGGYSMTEQAADLAQLLQTWHPEPVHLVGSAMGGVIGMHVALRRPELLRSLTLLASSGDSEEEKTRMQLLATGIKLLGTRPFAKRIIHTLFAEKFLENQENRLIVDHWRKQIVEHDRGGLAQAIRGWAQRPTMLGLAPAVELPTLIIAGEKDPVFDPEHSKRLHTAIPKARLSIVPQAGHCPALEAPDAVNELLGNFLAGLRGGGAKGETLADF